MVHDSTRESVPQYRAFISYSHADTLFARWLHRQLESAKDADGNRLYPVFIDRAELTAAPDLTAQVRTALSGSEALIVIASPSARASQWVTQEIELFRELHPESPIYAALIEGEPAKAFPQPLLVHHGQPVEPLAADFRKGHDGKRLGLLKIVAGLTGQPLDRLVQRDAQSRQRRVMAVTAGAVLLSLVLSAMLVVAIRARSEAERQRAEAEGLVEYMLTDLRDRLKGVGSATAMASVNERALVYYSRQQLNSLPDESLDRRARVLHAMGEDFERLGKFQPAQAMYQEAWRITGEVLARHSSDPDAIFTHAQSEYWVGEAAWQQGDLATTETHWRGYLVQAEALARAEPGTRRSRMELGYASGNLCELNVRKGRNFELALTYCEKASSEMQAALALQPGHPETALAYANRLGWQADVELKIGRPARTIELRRKEATILDGLLVAEPENAAYRERRLWPEIGIGEALIEDGQIREAVAVLRPCLAQYDRLAQIRADDTIITEQRLRATVLLAKAARAIGSSEAKTLAGQAIALHGDLTRTHSARQMTRFDKMIAELNKGGRQ